MKVRNGFVSNSSSSSFVVLIPSKDGKMYSADELTHGILKSYWEEDYEEDVNDKCNERFIKYIKDGCGAALSEINEPFIYKIYDVDNYAMEDFERIFDDLGFKYFNILD